jgi:hypothetical protein
MKFAARLLADREVLPQALQLNPAFFKVVYADLLNAKKTRKAVLAALDAIDRYVAERAPALFEPVIDHLREAGEARSCTEIEAHFERNFDVSGVTIACEYLADQGLIGKAATPVHLVPRQQHGWLECACEKGKEPLVHVSGTRSGIGAEADRPVRIKEDQLADVVIPHVCRGVPGHRGRQEVVEGEQQGIHQLSTRWFAGRNNPSKSDRKRAGICTCLGPQIIDWTDPLLLASAFSIL